MKDVYQQLLSQWKGVQKLKVALTNCIGFKMLTKNPGNSQSTNFLP